MLPFTQVDLTGFRAVGPGRWDDAHDITLAVHYLPFVPDLPAPLHDPQRLLHDLAHRAAGAGGCLIEGAVDQLDGVPALWQLVKAPLPKGGGQGFHASWTVPRAECSAVLSVTGGERHRTGGREAAVMQRVGHRYFFRPGPYAPQLRGGLPHHVADDEYWDPHFPAHPLTRVRAVMYAVTPGLRLDAAFRLLPPFGAGPPAGHWPGPPQTPPPGPGAFGPPPVY